MYRVISISSAILLATTINGSASSGSMSSSPSHEPTLVQLKEAISASISETSIPNPTIPSLPDVASGPSMSEYNGQTGCGDEFPGDKTNVVTEVPCTFGDRTATRSVLLTGDSEANMWLPTLDAWGKAEHWKIVRLVEFGCVPWRSASNFPECLSFDARVASWIRKNKPQIVYPVGLVESNQTAWVNISGVRMAREVEGMVNSWEPAKPRVLVPQPIPWFFKYGDPLMCLASYPTTVKKCNLDPRSKTVSAGLLSGLTIAAKAGTIKVVPIDQLFCAPKTCPVLVGAWVVYRDQHHMSRTWGNHIERAFAEVFDPLVGRSG